MTAQLQWDCPIYDACYQYYHLLFCRLLLLIIRSGESNWSIIKPLVDCGKIFAVFIDQCYINHRWHTEAVCAVILSNSWTFSIGEAGFVPFPKVSAISGMHEGWCHHPWLEEGISTGNPGAKLSLISRWFVVTHAELQKSGFRIQDRNMQGTLGKVVIKKDWHLHRHEMLT